MVRFNWLIVIHSLLTSSSATITSFVGIRDTSNPSIRLREPTRESYDVLPTPPPHPIIPYISSKPTLLLRLHMLRDCSSYLLRSPDSEVRMSLASKSDLEGAREFEACCGRPLLKPRLWQIQMIKLTPRHPRRPVEREKEKSNPFLFN